MNYLKFTKFLKEDFEISNAKYISINFFRSELILVFIWFWVLEKHYQSKENQIFNSHVEILIAETPKGFASRPTIFKFVDQAIDAKFIIKVSDQLDKRKWHLLLSEQTIIEFEDWAKGFSGF